MDCEASGRRPYKMPSIDCEGPPQTMQNAIHTPAPLFTRHGGPPAHGSSARPSYLGPTLGRCHPLPHSPALVALQHMGALPALLVKVPHTAGEVLRGSCSQGAVEVDGHVEHSTRAALHAGCSSPHTHCMSTCDGLACMRIFLVCFCVCVYVHAKDSCVWSVYVRAKDSCVHVCAKDACVCGACMCMLRIHVCVECVCAY